MKTSDGYLVKMKSRLIVHHRLWVSHEFLSRSALAGSEVRSPKSQFIDNHANQNINGIRGDIKPRKRGAEHEVTQRCATYRIEPRRLVKLQELDKARSGQGESSQMAG